MGLARLLAFALFLASAAALAVADPPAAGGFVGDQACRSCHQDTYRSWLKTAHAQASSSLAAREQSSPLCRACHATGLAPTGPSPLAGVQCEACHGGGADYSADDIMRNPPLARSLGLRDLSTPEKRARLCMSCHRESTRLAPFAVERAWQAIRH